MGGQASRRPRPRPRHSPSRNRVSFGRAPLYCLFHCRSEVRPIRLFAPLLVLPPSKQAGPCPSELIIGVLEEGFPQERQLPDLFFIAYGLIELHLLVH